MAQGEMFSTRDVRNGNKVCVIGNTVKKNLFPNASPLGQEIRINNVSFRVVGVLSAKGANMMGMDQDNLVLAPWSTIKYRVSGTTLGNTNQSVSSSSTSSATSNAVNTLSNLYPGSTALYPSRSTTYSLQRGRGNETEPCHRRAGGSCDACCQSRRYSCAG
jgi:ABC-type antimicrobial peptide transport system permease subunit